MSFKFSEFLKKKPIKRPGIVAVVGDFDPPAIGHETVFNEAARLANANRFPMRIFVENKNQHILTCAQRKYFIEKIFPRYKHYIAEKNISTKLFSNFLDENFKKVIYISAPDKIDPSSLKESFDIWSSGVRDPENPSTVVTSSFEMTRLAKEGLFEEFSSNLPSNTHRRYAKELFESIRVSFDLPKRPPVIFERAPTREEFYSGVFNVGDKVHTKNLEEGTIKEIGANFIVVDVNGHAKRFWPKDIMKI
jgi:hypothetical protein